MPFDPRSYTHESDRATLAALQAIPGFPAVCKAFMSVWNERQDRILNMSSRIRISEDQLGRYYRMLPPVCEQLGIPVPDLFLEMNVNPNAYTSGDTNPYIVLTSGLLDQVEEELIPTVLAHECSHIACHHVLYLTMGRTILNGAGIALSMTRNGGLLTVPLRVAFYYWMRSSEFSADRGAVLCDGSPDNMQAVCMRLAGFGKGIRDTGDIETFMRQAEDYQQMVSSSKWDRTLEYMILSGASHPLMAVRALECQKWADSPRFLQALQGLPPETDGGSSLARVKTDTIDFLRQQGKRLTDTIQGAGQKNQDPFVLLAEYEKLMEAGKMTREEFEAKRRELIYGK